MRRSASMRLAGTVAACLAGIVSITCCKSYVQAEIEPCPKATTLMLMDLDGLNEEGLHEPVVAYLADEILPYCAGIGAVNE